MKKVLVICGHSDYEHSTANKAIMDILSAKLPNAECRTLAQLYPDGKIDVETEQNALLQADIIVFQYPFNWYDYPYLLKQYFDLVFEHNFAYGSVRKLVGKKLILSFTIGGDHQSYSKEGSVHMDIPEFLKPMIASADLCGIEFCEPVYSFDMTYLPNSDDEKRKAEVISKAQEQAETLIQEIEKLRA